MIYFMLKLKQQYLSVCLSRCVLRSSIMTSSLWRGCLSRSFQSWSEPAQPAPTKLLQISKKLSRLAWSAARPRLLFPAVLQTEGSAPVRSSATTISAPPCTNHAKLIKIRPWNHKIIGRFGR